MGTTITDFKPVALLEPKVVKKASGKDIIGNLLDATLGTEGLMEGQTPLRKNDTSRNWKHILGTPVDTKAVIPKDRKNFFWVAPEKRDDVIKKQWKNYFKHPERFGLTEDSTLEDAIKKFDQQHPENKTKYLQDKGIDIKKKLKDFNVSLLNNISNFILPTASAETKNNKIITDFIPVTGEQGKIVTDFAPVGKPDSSESIRENKPSYIESVSHKFHKALQYLGIDPYPLISGKTSPLETGVLAAGRAVTGGAAKPDIADIQAMQQHPVATAIGNISGSIVPYVATAAFFPPGLLGSIGSFATVGAGQETLRQLDKKNTGLQKAKEIGIEAAKQGSFGIPFHYANYLKSVAHPILAALGRAGVKGVSVGSLSALYGNDLKQAIGQGGLITGLSLIFEVPSLAKTGLGRGIVRQVNRVAKESGLPEGKYTIDPNKLNQAVQKTKLSKLLNVFMKLRKAKGKPQGQLKLPQTTTISKKLPQPVSEPPQPPKVAKKPLTAPITPTVEPVSMAEANIAPETLASTEITKARSFPKAIKPVGNEFWIELMDTAKKILTPYRYNALRKNFAGTFSSSGGVKLKDIRDVITAAHELGHNIDWITNEKSFPNSIKKRFDTNYTEKELRNELKEVSKEMRPDLWTNPKGTPYLNKHTELMADFVSRYILDPEGTKKIAPKMTSLFEKKLPNDIKSTLGKLQKYRQSGTGESPITGTVKKKLRISDKELKLEVKDSEDYIKQTHNLGVDKIRQNTVLLRRADVQAKRIDELVPDLDRQVDLVVIAEKGSKNPYTNKTREEIRKTLTDKEKQAIKTYRGYQELARQTVNKYLRNVGYSEYIKFLDDYFIHFYETPLTKKYKSAVGKWYKSSPQAKRRILPDLAKAVELGLEPKAKTLSEGIRLWSGVNYKVAGNIAYLKELPKIVNADGESIIQKPKDKPDWPTRDYWALRKTYAIPIKGRGILLFQGRVAIDPKVVSSIDVLFKTKSYNPIIRTVEKVNATAKAFELTFFSFFHHQTEAFSAFGAFGHKVVTGLWGKEAQELGGKKVLGISHIGLLSAGRKLENIPEFTEDYILHGGKLGRITTEGINEVDKMLIALDSKLKEKGTSVSKVLGFPVGKTKEAYQLAQNILWDNVTRLKLITYYNLVDYGLKTTDLPVNKVKEIIAKYVNNNYGGQEWVNVKLMRNPKFRQAMNLSFLSSDWTLSQIRMGLSPFKLGKSGEAAFAREIGRKHWAKWTMAVVTFTVLGNYMFTGKPPWENERGHKIDIDWTPAWRGIDEIFSKAMGKPDWKQRKDFTHRYISLGKAGRELVRYFTEGIKAVGYKLSPLVSETGKQLFGTTMGSDYPAEWKREELNEYEKIWARIKSTAGKFKPFSLSGNNAFLSFPSRKGMTEWKATRSLSDIYRIKAREAEGGIQALTTQLSKGIFYNENTIVRDIKQAADINKVDFNKVNRWANSKVRGEYYRKFWYRILRGRGKQTIKALKVLGVTLKTLKSSGKRRGISPLLIDKAVRMFNLEEK